MQVQVTGATPYYAIVTSLSNGSLLDASKIKNAPIELKYGMGTFLSTPDTMATSVLRENDVITPILLTCHVKNKGAPIALKICTIVVWTSPDTMTVLFFRFDDVIKTLPRSLAHLLHKKSKCSDCAEIRNRRS